MGTLEQMVKHFEGFRAEPYECPGGHMTIGYGHKILPGESFTKISKQEASLLLVNDLGTVETLVDRLVRVPLTLRQRWALCSWTFNLGFGNLQHSTLLQRLNEGDFKAASKELIRWNKVKGKVNKGLKRRRQAEQRMFLGQDWKTGKKLEETKR